MFKLTGMEKVQASFNRLVKQAENEIVAVRKQVAKELIDALLLNIPVWSGKTVRSIAVDNAGRGGNRNEPHPQRRDYELDGEFHYDELYGPTNSMRMGREPMRPVSEKIARASVQEADYSLNRQVFIASDAYLWPYIQNAKAPDERRARNTALVSEIAIAQIKAKFGKVLK